MLKHYIRHYWLYLFPLGLIFSLCVLFEPTWMTNDDAAMSMIAHGYGSIADASPKLIFSNVLWGHWVQSLPTIGGLYGYSLATLLVLLISGTCLTAILIRTEIHPLIVFLALLLVLIQAVLTPQFTLTAGLISIAAVLMVREYSRQPHSILLILGCFCLFSGFLIRREEAILICAIAFPLLPWPTLVKKGKFLLAAGLTVLALVFATVIDMNSYEDSQWKEYQTLMPAVLPLVAFDAAPQLLAQPELLEKHQYSENDIKLIERWLWFDREIASPERLQSLMAELGDPTSLPLLGKQRLVPEWPTSIKQAFMALSDRSIFFLFLCALLVLAIRPSKSLFMSWMIFFVALILMGAIGRPGELRVYIPALALLFLAPLVEPNKQTLRLYKLQILGLSVLVCIHTMLTFGQARDRQALADEFRTRLSTLPQNEMISGYYSTIKANLVYSVTGAADLAGQHNNLYLFGWPAVTPYSVAYQADISGNGFKEKLLSREGVWILINNETLLENYCRERKLTLLRLAAPSLDNGGAKRISCQPIAPNLKSL